MNKNGVSFLASERATEPRSCPVLARAEIRRGTSQRTDSRQMLPEIPMILLTSRDERPALLNNRPRSIFNSPYSRPFLNQSLTWFLIDNKNLEQKLVWNNVIWHYKISVMFKINYNILQLQTSNQEIGRVAECVSLELFFIVSRLCGTDLYTNEL